MLILFVFIPLLSSFACAIPGIMATRTIANPRDRLVTILISPMMTWPARLPVYALPIGAFVPNRKVGALGLWQRAAIFMRRVGTIILVLTIALWFRASFPGAPEGATRAAIEYSFAGMLGHGLSVLLAPIGFNWQISIALVPGLAGREVAVSALGTVYALSAIGSDTAQALSPIIAQSWGLATALALPAWYVFAPQCMATLATVRRERKWALVMAGYLFALAYIASFVTYRTALALGRG